ncbi:GNAT family N-acetyltransferase [Treponema sp. OttesenSCG-928-L16]|nr:GNAT family N-acetyltransferase [Treponema sp. OttesenSCG-928-L16]
MYFKKMAGEKCYLSPVSLEDAEIFTRWLNDEEVTRSLELYSAVITLHGEKEALVSLSKNHNYSIIDSKSNELLGNCGLMDINHLNRSAEAGIFIGNKNYWNRGYGTEALSLLIDFAFKRLNLHNIMLRVYAFNERAIACYRKVGFKIIGTRREALQRDLKIHDIIYMDILPADFYGTAKKDVSSL